MRFALLAAAALLGACTQLFLHPGRQQVLHPQKLGLAYEDVWLAAADGAKRHGWYLPAAGTARGTVLHLHGNAENVSTFIAAVHWLPARGYNVLLLDYRGYGRSEGRATVANVHEDARDALVYLLRRPGVDSRRLVLFGQSLGGSAAIYTAAHHATPGQVRAVIAEGAFSRYSRIAREKLDQLWLTWALQWPLSLLFSDRYSAEDALARLQGVPLLLVHGDQDPVVPLSHARRLYDAARGRRELWSIAGGKHVDAFTRPGLREENRERLVRYLDSLTSLPSSVTVAAK